MKNNDMKISFDHSSGFSISVFDFPHEHNWKNDLQPGAPGKGVDGYIRDAEVLHSVFMDYLSDLVSKYAPDAFLMVEKSIKTEGSARRKLMDEDIMGDPSRIGDYLRAKIVIRASSNPDVALAQIETLRSHLMFDSGVTAYNDRFRRPCPEGGHRAFAVHRLFDNGDGVAQKAEIQVVHEAYEFGPYDEAVKRIRGAERAIAPCVKGDMHGKLTGHFLNEARMAYDFLQRARRSAHEEAAAAHGLNALLDPDLKRQPTATLDNVVTFKPPKSRPLQAVGRGLREAVGFLGEDSMVGSILRRVIG
jgi:hypothetical protein